MTILTDKTCLDTEYYTPPSILEPIRNYFRKTNLCDIGLDPATADTNPTKAVQYFTKEANGLLRSWRGGWPNAVFINPPFGREIRDWVAKIREEAEAGCHIIALLPGQRFETEYWQRDVFNPHLRTICFIRKRIAFLGPDGKPRIGNPYGSMLYLYNGEMRPFADSLGSVGLCIAPIFL